MSDDITVEYRFSSVRILDSIRSADAVQSGRHPGCERMLWAVDNEGRALVSAFEFDDFWQIDIEYRALQLVGIKPLASETHGGFRVRSEEQAVSWLEFISRAVTR